MEVVRLEVSALAGAGVSSMKTTSTHVLRAMQCSDEGVTRVQSTGSRVSNASNRSLERVIVKAEQKGIPQSCGIGSGVVTHQMLLRRLTAK